MQASIRVLVAAVLISGFNLFYFDVASADITIDGETIHVQTDAYSVQFDRGVMTHIHNRLTDKTYTVSSVKGASVEAGLLFNRYWWEAENISTSWAELISTIQIDPHSTELLFRHEGTDIRLSIAVDPMTDDLLIDMEGVSDTRGVVGMQWGLGTLGMQNLSVIVPAAGGQALDATTPIDHYYYRYPGSGPGQIFANYFRFVSISVDSWLKTRKRELESAGCVYALLKSCGSICNWRTAERMVPVRKSLLP